MILGPGRPVPAGLTLSAAASAATTARAADVDQLLGLSAPASRNVARLLDPATGQTVDEVTDLDSGGRPTAVSRFDTAGQLVSSVRLGYAASIGTPISAAAAATAAHEVLARVGISMGGSPSVTARPIGGWLVRWIRVIGDVPVPGDGVSVQLAASGSFHAMVRSAHPLGTAPATTIEPARVRLLALARIDAWFAPGLRSEATVSSPGLAWIAPNDTFGDPIPAGLAGRLRLAWVVRVTTSGTLADRVRGLELAFDAGDGTPLGGDVLE